MELSHKNIKVGKPSISVGAGLFRVAGPRPQPERPAKGLTDMDCGRPLFVMIALASAYLTFTLSVVTLVHFGSLSWASARELLESVTWLSSLAVGGVIGYQLSSITAK